MLVSRISPAPRRWASIAQSTASSSAGILPPWVKTIQRSLDTRLASIATTMNCEPNARAPSVISSGRCTAAVWIEILSAPARSRIRISSTSWMPPPTLRGMKTSCAVRSTSSTSVARPSGVASMSRKVSSSAPSSEYFRARATGSPWSRSCWKCVPLTTRPPAVSRQGMIRFDNIGIRLGRGLGIHEAQEVLEQAQSGGAASFGMELHAHQPLAGDRADERNAVRGLGGGDRGVSWHDHIGMHEVEGLALHRFQHRVLVDAFDGVPADMGQFLLRFHQLHRAGKDTQAGGAVLGAPVEEQLHAQADSKEGDPVANGRNDGLVEAAISQAGHGRRRRANARKDDGPRVGQILGGRGDGAGGVEARQGIFHAAQVAATVVDERDH